MPKTTGQDLLFRVSIQVEPLVGVGDLDPLDRQNPLLANVGTRVYVICASDPEAAERAAIGRFRERVGISVRGDFDINVETVQLGAHETLAWRQKHPGLSALHGPAAGLDASIWEIWWMIRPDRNPRFASLAPGARDGG